MVSYGIATVGEIMSCTWSQIKMERLFLQLIKKKLTSLDKFSPLYYHKTLNSSTFLFPPLKFQKNIFPHWHVPSSFTKGGGGEGGGEYGYVGGSSFWCFKSWISIYKRTKAETLEKEQEQKIKLKRPEISVHLIKETKSFKSGWTRNPFP